MGKAGIGESDTTFAERRQAARSRLDELDPHRRPGGVNADPLRRDWFEAVYELAGEDAAQIPWADLMPHPLLADWLACHGDKLVGKLACDVGCGLGDNAEALAAAGARVMAFDLVPRAVDWARRRFPALSVRYQAADLFALPDDWLGRFDFVHECYTLQALPGERLPAAARSLCTLLAPAGQLLVIARAPGPATKPGPPWPLTRESLEMIAAAGFALAEVEALRPAGLPHWRARFIKSDVSDPSDAGSPASG